MKLNQLLFLLAFLIGVNTLIAQQHNFTNYSVVEGLAQSQVPAMLEDQYGYLWVGTSGGGLSRFDGKNFETYTTQNGLSSNYITALLEVKNGRILIGTTNGISVYENGQITVLDQKNNLKITPNQFLETENGKIWIAANDGLYFVDNEGNSDFNKQITLKKTKTFYTLYKGKNGQIWAGSQRGLFKIIGNTITEIKQENNKPFQAIQAITETEDGVLWIASYNQGVYLADGDKILRKLTENDGLVSTRIQTLITDKSGDIWLGTADRGLIKWQTKNRNFLHLTTQQGLANNNVKSMLADSWGNIWVGTSGGGISKYSGQQFEHYTKAEGLNGNYIYALESDSEGRLWVATSGNGIQLYERGSFRAFGANSTLRNTACKAIFEDQIGHIWFGTVDNGLTVFLDSLFLTFTDENGLASNFVTVIEQDAYGNIWTASESNGITKIEWNDTLPSQSIFTTYTTQNGLPLNRINDLHIDRENRVWVATDGGGIALIEDQIVTKKWTKQEGLAENVIRTFSEDSLGFLWYGTASFGIGNIQIYKEDFNINNDYKRLISNNIKLLKADQYNDIWIGSETGLEYFKLDAARNVLSKEHYGRTDGFRGIETSRNAVLEDAANNLWFGTVNGLTKFNPAFQKGKEYPPKIYLKNAQIGEQNFSETPYKSLLQNWTNLSLPYDQNELRFEVAALHLSYPNNLQYQWKMAEKKNIWSAQTANNDSYQGIFLPGKYTLQVRATTAKGKVFSETLSFPFEIVPPYWQSWKFRFAATFLGLCLIALFVRWRTNVVKKRAKRIQDRLELDKKLLELEQKALQLQMNPHFIFNALNSIQGSITPQDIKTARLQLAKFSKLMRGTLENSRTDSIPLEEEIGMLSNYLSLEQFSQGDTFDYEINVADNIDPESVYLPTMILQPFVENAIIHGVAHLKKRGKINVAFSRKGKRLSCIVEDNGIGQAAAKELKSQIAQSHKSAALEITRERLDLLRSGKAVKNSLQIMDLKDDAGNALGTRVEIIIPVEE